MKVVLAFLAVLIISAAARAETGYVVKTDSNTIYLDLGKAAGAEAGQDFLIYSEGSAIKHPVTGEVLGREEKRIAQGTIDQVYPKYSTGRLSAADGAISAGQRAKLLPKAPPPPAPQPAPAPAATAAASMQGSVRQPVFRGQPVNLEAVDLAVGDVDGDGKNDIILADQTRVEVFPYDMPAQGTGEWKPFCSYEDKTTGTKILSVDAGDLEKTGRAKIFATIYNSFFNRVETVVLECKDHTLSKVATLPWAVRGYYDETGAIRLAAQELVGDMTFPFGNIYALQFADGKYEHGERMKMKRLEWIYGFGLGRGSDPTDIFPIFVTGTNRLRAQFKKGAWLSPEDYAQTSSRIRWYERPLMFYPRLVLTESAGGTTGLYTVKNIAALGGLAGTWGIYNNAEVHHLKWNGMSLDPDWRGDLGGYAADLVLAQQDASHPQELLVAVVANSGRTSILKFQP